MPDIVDRLAALPLLAPVPRTDLEWLVAHGDERSLAEGTEFSSLSGRGSGVDEMWVLLEGRAGLYQQQGGATRKLLEVKAGQILGVLPYSRFQGGNGFVRIEENVNAFVLHRNHFPEMMRDHPGLTTVLVHLMLDRAREFRTLQLGDERLASLSRLASGFAHELNNPASAAARTARALVELQDDEERAARELAAANLSAAHLAAIDAIRTDCRVMAPHRTALEMADREDDITDWLAAHALGADVAATLAATHVTMAALDELARALPKEALGTAIRWVASGCASRDASRQIEAATARIHELVDAVRGFTFMDRHGAPEDVDVARGLADTLAMLDGKARAKAAIIQLETARDLPHVHGFGSEINQVWAKLVDNALDAIGDQGHVTITATTRGESILVRIADDGPGIPEDVRSRVFEPFFTTKPVGKGTGLGLDIARRIVERHNGDIGFNTQPGHTVFRVQLPLRSS